VIDQAIDLGYEPHVRHAPEAAAPTEIVCVGIGVGTSSRPVRRIGATVTVVPQPNSRLTAAEHEASYAV
jgi:hypothetical protein